MGPAVQGLSSVFINPPAFNLGGAVQAPFESGQKELTATGTVSTLLEDARIAYKRISENRGYFRPWEVEQQGCVIVKALAPWWTRFFGARPNWREVVSSRLLVPKFSVRWEIGTDWKDKVVASTFVRTPNADPEPKRLDQRTELTVGARGEVLEGMSKFTVLGGMSLVHALVDAGIIAAADIDPKARVSSLSSSVLPIANFLLKGAGEGKWVLDTLAPKTYLDIKEGRFVSAEAEAFCKAEKGQPISFSIRKDDGSMGVEFRFCAGSCEGEPLPYPVNDTYKLMVWQHNPLRPDKTFAPFTKEFGQIAKAAATYVFSGHYINFNE